MIARIWHGTVPDGKSDDYLTYLKQSGIKDYLSTDGNCGVYVLRRSKAGQTHYLLLTLWDSEESIRRFAGDDIEKARYYPNDKKYLLEFEPSVIHYEIAVMHTKSSDID